LRRLLLFEGHVTAVFEQTEVVDLKLLLLQLGELVLYHALRRH